MPKQRKAVMSLFVVLTIAILTSLAALHIRSQNAPHVKEQQYDPAQFPTTDYAKPEPSDPEKRRLRQTRGNRFKMKGKPEDVKRFAITEQRQSGFGSFEIHAKPEPAIPAAQSDAVVIGEVTDAEAFLSADKTAIYSEFTVSISEVLKDASPCALNFGTAITAIRGGGAVRFPSGKVVWEAFDGKPFPRIGRKYVVFLKYNGDGQDFSILTAYELRAGRVFPLDGLYTTGEIVYQLVEHQKFSGMDETDFLTKVREAIALAASNTSEGGM